jgi:hypothetical protein
MPVVATLVLAAAVAASPPPTRSPLRLSGLDRLYFTHVGGADNLTAPPRVAALLPRRLLRASPIPAASPSPSLEEPEESRASDIAVTDFLLEVPAVPGFVFLRQVVDSHHPRITELWLALYDGERRSDVWHFQALPRLTDNKLLPNYWVDAIPDGPEGTVILRLRGSMSRPQGAWWANGKLVTLTLADGVLTLAHVRDAFGFIQGYDGGGDSYPPDLSVSVERAVGGRFERRVLDSVPAEVLKSCGAASADDIGGTWEDMEDLAECVTRSPDTTVSSRALREPSFAERGYNAKE